MQKLFLFAALFATLSSLGCCRACCWQRGGSWYNGYCYPQVPPAVQPIPQPQQQYYAPPTYAQPCTCQ